MDENEKRLQENPFARKNVIVKESEVSSDKKDETPEIKEETKQDTTDEKKDNE